MFSRKLYTKLVCLVILIVLFSFIASWLLITGVSYTLSFGSLLIVLLIMLLIIRLINRTNQQISVFFHSLLNNDPTRYYPEEADNAFERKLYTEMNRITSHLAESRAEVEEKRLYYEGILRVLTHEIRN